ncbi:tRNA uridine-5-carboxymethylaminomethyl(34) synthesis enzyme MnmG [Alphaproteobacteria bacterium]|nr:tRNA uridine-5-carboxymethylaminomethyl(34) synthesis enzyme MnmG [Alphaproteobacteria bacterium]
MIEQIFDVAVIGGGHAGCEAAAAASRIGANTCLITKDINSIGVMSCNPAFGGIGKGHLIREIDALDGLIGKASDFSAIQYRELNRKKGPAVRGPRVQSDRSLYKTKMLELLKLYHNLYMKSGSVIKFNHIDTLVKEIILIDGSIIKAKSIVLTTGTFLGGIIHLGNKQTPAGRYGEDPANELSVQLKSFGFKTGRLKTGTPPRLYFNSINWDKLQVQHGDKDPKFMSFLTKDTQAKQVPCYITHTNKKCHQIIKDNITSSAIYNGNISGTGPRYCPSIEDKVSRFFKKTSHQIFLEPEGLDSNLVYPNGISTSLPEEVQDKFIKSIFGLENAKIHRYGYAIEYDYVDPTELFNTLETKKINSLFFAGQINGTTGYEEAAAQGLIAGANAALKVRNHNPFIVQRSDGYIGILIDDLISNGVTEPYRMFTARSEYRISHRADNADQRLTPLGINVGLISNSRKQEFNYKLNQLNQANAFINKTYISPNEANKLGIKVVLDGKKRNLQELLAYPHANTCLFSNYWPELKKYDKEVLEQLEIQGVYLGYLDRQYEDIESFKRDELLRIPIDINYSMVGGLSNEMKEMLSIARPSTFGAASRLRGITPGGLVALLSYVRADKVSAN